MPVDGSRIKEKLRNIEHTEKRQRIYPIMLDHYGEPSFYVPLNERFYMSLNFSSIKTYVIVDCTETSSEAASSPCSRLVCKNMAYPLLVVWEQ